MATYDATKVILMVNGKEVVCQGFIQDTPIVVRREEDSNVPHTKT